MNILNRKVFSSIITLIIILGIIYFIATTTNLYPINRASIDHYEENTNYGIVMSYSKHGILPIVLKSAYIVNIQGDIMNKEDLLFDWSLWNTYEDFSGVFIIEHNAKFIDQFKSPLDFKTTNKEIKLILEISPKSSFSKSDDLFLELHYEVWGIKKVVRRLI